MVETTHKRGARFGTLLVLVVALILYGSTYPWDFAETGPEGVNRLWLLLHTWPVAMNRWMFRDLFLNVMLYVPVGAFAYLKLSSSFGPVLSATLAIAGGTVLSASVEILQQFEISRASSAVDLVSNIAGTAAGVAFGRMYRSTLARWASLRIPPGDGDARGAFVLLLAWTGYQLAPLFPALSTSRLINEIQALLQPSSFSLSELLASAGEWLAVARLLEALSVSRIALPVLMLVVPARLLIAGRTDTSSELLGAIAAWLLWTFWLSKQGYRTQWTAALTLASIAIRGLAPLDFSPTPQPFSWIPLAGSLSYEYFAAVVTLLRKAFVYGAALWLLNQSGAKRLTAALSVAAMLGAIEAVQVYLPTHVPEITDPLLALLLAVVLRILRPGLEGT